MNLLPWRQRRRVQQKRRFLVGLGIALGVVAWYEGHEISQLHKKISYTRTQNAALTAEDVARIPFAEAAETLKQTKILHATQDAAFERQWAQHLKVINFLETLQLLPTALYLSACVRQDETLIINGMANAAYDVSQWAKAIDSMGLGAQSTLQQIARHTENTRYPFAFSVKVALPPQAEEEHAE